MYKIKAIVDYWNASGMQVPEEFESALNNLKTMTDDFATGDDVAKKLDDLLYRKIENKYPELLPQQQQQAEVAVDEQEPAIETPEKPVEKEPEEPLEEKPLEKISLDDDVKKLIEFLDTEDDVQKKAQVWNEGIDDDEGKPVVASRNRLVRGTGGLTLWQIGNEMPVLELKRHGEEQKIGFSGKHLLIAIKRALKENGYELDEESMTPSKELKKDKKAKLTHFFTEILQKVKQGTPVLFASTDYAYNNGLPHINTIENADHMGFGVFKAPTKTGEVTFDGGGAMQRIDGEAYTILGGDTENVQFKDGTVGYPYDKVIKVLEQLIGGETHDITPEQPISAEDIKDEVQAIEETLPVQANLFDDDWYKKYPEKILGESYEASGRFGTVIKIRGDMDDVEKIVAAIPASGQVKNPTVSQVNQSGEQTAKQTDGATEIPKLKKIIEKSKDSIVEKQRSKRRAKVDAYEPPEPPEVLSFEEVYKMLNPESDITPDEARAFVLYKELQGQKLSKKWYDVVGADYYDENWADVEDYVKRGLLFSHRGELMPGFLYFAENVYERKTALAHSKDDIIKAYGKEVYDRQFERLEAVVAEKLKDKKTLDDDDLNNRLIIKPLSEFARSFMIKTLVDENLIVVHTMTVKGQSVVDFKGKIGEGWYNKKDIEEMSLIDAFKYWLRKYESQILFKQGTNWHEIISVYLDSGSMPKDTDKTEWSRTKARSMMEGDRLFSEFLAHWLTLEDKNAIEIKWNDKFNGYVKIDYYKVPVAFTTAKKWGHDKMEIKPEKREAVAFAMLNRSGLLAYDVGVGKTPSAIFTISSFMDAGYCSRPLIVVPNSVYRQFKAEIEMLAPHLKYKINDLYNLGSYYMDQIKGKGGKVNKMEEGSISIITYDGFERIGFDVNTQARIFKNLYEILTQGENMKASDKKSAKEREAFKEKLEAILGKGQKGAMVSIEDLGFDFMCVDEAHSMKKVFVRVKGESQGEGKRSVVRYKIQSGSKGSDIAIKGFCMSRYIAENNFDGNILFLTATPFTNSPLEVFSMLALVAYKKLQDTNLNNLNNFFDTYIQVTHKLIINSRLQPQRKEVFDGWINLTSLQQLIFRFINHKDVNTKDSRGNKIALKRPSKWIFPLRNRMEGETKIEIPKEEQVDTSIRMSPLQQELMANVIAYTEGKMEFEQLQAMGHLQGAEMEESDTPIEDMTESEELQETMLDKKETLGVRLLRSVNFARNIALNPYTYEYSGLGVPKNYKEYVEASPKMMYVMRCIASVKKYHEDHGTPMSGQIIYADRGKSYFHFIKQYLVKELGFEEHEVGIISSGMTGGKTAKEDIKNKFLGLELDKSTDKLLPTMPHEKRMKVLIGSSSIREGMNLQRHTSVLYDLFMDWNPSDFQQLQGRCHRQGNLFNNVRIVVPLMEDSMDIFMFQKLGEKTDRINALFESIDQKVTVLPVEEFNPDEIKYALITDPYVLARMKVDDMMESMRDRVYGLRYEKTVSETNRGVLKASNQPELQAEVRQVVNRFRGEKERTKEQLINTYVNLIRTQTDAEGKHVVIPETDYNLSLWHHEGKDQDVINKLDGFDQWRKANMTLTKKIKDWFLPKKITPTEKGIDAYLVQIESDIKDAEEAIKGIDNEEKINELAKEIIDQKKKLKVKSKTYEDRAIEFAKYNYLLDDKQEEQKQPDAKLAEKLSSCPPVDEKGKKRIDEEAIDLLEKCNKELIQTKHMHTTDGETYTSERIALHNEIIKKEMQKAVCIENQKPIAILTGGAPGSGKTTYMKKYAAYLTSDKIFRIDQDALREYLPEYKGWNATQTHQETRDISRRILANISQGKPCTFDILYDGTMNTGKNYIPLVEKLKDLGYAVYIIYVKIDKDTSIQRTLYRYRNDGDNGRYVPQEVIREYFDREGETFEILKGMVNGWVEVDGITSEKTDDGGEEIPKERNYFDASPADLSKVLDGEVHFDEPKKPEEPKPKIRIKKVTPLTPAPKEEPVTTEPKKETPEERVVRLGRRITVFKELLKDVSGKDDQQRIKRRIETFKNLLELAKEEQKEKAKGKKM